MSADNRFAKLPIVIRKRPGRVVWRVLQILVLAIWAVILANSSYRFDDEPMLLVAGLCGGLCLLLEMALRLRAHFATVVCTVDRTGVQGTAGGASWREPLSAYEGVLWHEEYRHNPTSGSADASRTQRITLLELRHRFDPERTVRLLRQTKRAGIRACWETAAGSLRLPALRELPDGTMLQRQPDDLDKSLRELAREGRLELPRHDLSSPPDDIEWHPTQPWQARVRQEATFRLLIFIASFIIPLIALVAVAVGESALPLIVALAPLVGYVYRTRSGFRVGIVGRELQVAFMLGGIVLRTWRFSVDEVEQIWAAPVVLARVDRHLQEVWVESDRRSVRFFPLSRPAADWLVLFIQTVVVQAPGTS